MCFCIYSTWATRCPPAWWAPTTRSSWRATRSSSASGQKSFTSEKSGGTGRGKQWWRHCRISRRRWWRRCSLSRRWRHLWRQFVRTWAYNEFYHLSWQPSATIGPRYRTKLNLKLVCLGDLASVFAFCKNKVLALQRQFVKARPQENEIKIIRLSSSWPIFAMPEIYIIKNQS